MAHRPELEFDGPFLRFGNTFFDREPLPAAMMDLSRIDSLDYHDASRVFLKYRMDGDYASFRVVPDYLRRNINGTIWHNLVLLYSFAMPRSEILRLYQAFEDEVRRKDQYISYYMLMLLLESQIHDCVRLSLDALEALGPDINHRDLAANYAMVVEGGIDYDRSSSRILRAQATGGSAAVAHLVRELLDETARAYPGRELQAFHAGVPVELMTVTSKLLGALGRPSFYEKIYFEKVMIEAFAGVDLSGFYDHSSLMPVRASIRLEEVAEQIAFDRFQPGRRYFFGRPIPD